MVFCDAVEITHHIITFPVSLLCNTQNPFPMSKTERERDRETERERQRERERERERDECLYNG